MISLPATRRSCLLAPMGLFVAALAVRVGAIALWHFDGLYGQDPFAYLDQARALANALPRGDWPATDFFWPNGYPLLAACAMWLVGPHAWAAQAVSVLMGSAVAPLAYLLCRDLVTSSTPRAGVLAGSIAAVAPLPVMSSTVVMADIPAVCWSTLSAWLLVRSTIGRRPVTTATASGLALGLATITRWNNAALAPLFAWYALRARGDGRRRPVWPYLPGALIGLAIVVLQVSVSLRDRPEGLVHPWVVGWNPLNAFRRTFETADGVMANALPVGLYYLQPFFHPALLVLPLGMFACWGAWRLAQRGERDALFLLLGWLAVMYAFLAGIPFHNLRFALSYWIPVVILCGVGADDLWTHARAGRPVRIVVVLSLAVMLAWSGRAMARFVARRDAVRNTVTRVEARIAADATLVTFDLTLTANHYTRLRVVELFVQDAASLEGLLRERRPLYLLVNPSNIDTQWRGRAPDANVRWLREHAQVTQVAEYPPYVLYEVRTPPPS